MYIPAGFIEIHPHMNLLPLIGLEILLWTKTLGLEILLWTKTLTWSTGVHTYRHGHRGIIKGEILRKVSEEFCSFINAVCFAGLAHSKIQKKKSDNKYKGCPSKSCTFFITRDYVIGIIRDFYGLYMSLSMRKGTTWHHITFFDESFGVLYRSSANIAYLPPTGKFYWDKLNENKNNPNKKVRIFLFLWQRMSHTEKWQYT